MSDDNSGENELAKRYYVLPADHPLRKHNLGLGGYREKPKQGIPDELLREIEDRISRVPPDEFGLFDPVYSRATPKQISQDGELIEPPDATLRRAKLFKEYERQFGHPVPGWALRYCDKLSDRLERAIKDGKPMEEFLDSSKPETEENSHVYNLHSEIDKKE